MQSQALQSRERQQKQQQKQSFERKAVRRLLFCCSCERLLLLPLLLPLPSGSLLAFCLSFFSLCRRGLWGCSLAVPARQKRESESEWLIKGLSESPLASSGGSQWPLSRHYAFAASMSDAREPSASPPGAPASQGRGAVDVVLLSAASASRAPYWAFGIDWHLNEPLKGPSRTSGATVA